MVKKEIDLSENYIKWFFELKKEDIPIAGGKGANLGEMFNLKYPVPPGFVITAQSFDYFLNQNNVKEKIKDLINSIDLENTAQLEKTSKEIRNLIENQQLPINLKNEILEAYHILSTENKSEASISQDALNILKNARESIFVSVRSSATTEDLATASFAGQQESFLNVKGDENLIEYVKKCFSSLYTARAIYYRNQKGFEEGKSLLAVVIQKMINSEKSGVIFSRDPVNLQENIVVEAVWGLGEGIVSGMINPDNYVVSRNLNIESTKITDKKIAIIRSGSGETVTVKLSPERSNMQVLTNGQICELAEYAMKLEEHYQNPQDIEFAIEDNKIYIVQSRPITTLKSEIKEKGTLSGNILLKGLGASPGIGVGTVRIVNTMADLSKIKKGDVLVTKMTNPDMVVSMQKSVAIVTDEGGITSHASIVSREMGIPAVVGTSEATNILKDGMKITVDGTAGKVYEGEVSKTRFTEVKPIIETKLKLRLILDLPDFADRAAESKINSVGLLRLEGIIAESGKHPILFEKENKLNEYSEIIKKGIEKIAVHFSSIWIRTSDIRSDEFNTLKGAPEQKELNPMLGLHGIRFSLKHPQLLEAEFEAIKKVALKYSDKKFGVMFPQIISVEELKQAKQILNKFKTNNMKVGIMIETPAAVQIIRQLCEEKIDFISFGTNDLTQFTLAVDRGNEEVQYLYNELHPAIASQIRKVIYACKEYKVKTSICGQAGSNPKMIKELLKYGIDSISVNADVAHDLSVYIKKLEEENNIPDHRNFNKPSLTSDIKQERVINMQEKREEKEPIENIDDFKEISEKSDSILEEIRNKNQQQIIDDQKREIEIESEEEQESAEEENKLSDETINPENIGVYNPDEKEEPSKNTFKYNFDDDEEYKVF
jgi:pyruvate, water dikinase